MLEQDREVAARIRWVRLYEELGNAGLVCRRCGISRPTLRKWVKRFERNGVPALRRPKRRIEPRRYSRPLPGDRVQLDTMKVRPGLYQYTAVDDCTRMRVLGLYSRRTAANAVDFLDRVVEELPFPVQRVQSDRGGEFFGRAFQRALRKHCIKFRPTPPRSPHLNGKVERSQQTDLIEFWATVDFASSGLADELEQWQMFYNWHRPHGALSGKTPTDRCGELLASTPLSHEVAAFATFLPSSSSTVQSSKATPSARRYLYRARTIAFSPYPCRKMRWTRSAGTFARGDPKYAKLERILRLH